ncbi:RnfH family protein [Paracidovorax sp. MALMAid1276]|uniref:RnfH family protein n=1 Tax=Paracidovorax sp. MALMAid1276 TaxID=3411631 RepID=UPI003B99AA99
MAEPQQETGAAGSGSGQEAPLQVTVVACVAPREVREWALQLPPGACVANALRACGLVAHDLAEHVGVWGRPVALDCVLKPHDRVEVYRPLLVDPKVARRERFARQGARSTGLFARRRPGAKSGY